MTIAISPATDTKRFYHNFINKSTETDMDINSVQLNIPKDISELLNKLEDSGYEAYIVGGAVRDAIMNRPCHDYDITTSAAPEVTKQIFSQLKTVDTGIKHGTVTVLTGANAVEITVFRCEGSYSDGRHPDIITFTDDVTEDLKRRDFTVNAIAYSEKRGFVDPFGGISDIENKIIRCVGDPEKRFTEDKLRLLRAVRFSSVLDFDIEHRTSNILKNMSGKINTVSAERIFSELCKLICGIGAKKCLSEYSELLFSIIPELRAQDGFDQNNPNHCHTLFKHTLTALENTPAVAEIRLAALLHDIGKPETMTVDEKGISHFHGHPEHSENIARSVLTRLKTGTEFKEHVCSLVKYHDVRFSDSKSLIRKYLGILGKDIFSQLLELQKADIKAQAPGYFYRLDDLDKVISISRQIIADGDALKIKDLAVNGDDLKKMGILPGKKMGEILSLLLDMVLNEDVINEKQALLRQVQLILDE